MHQEQSTCTSVRVVHRSSTRPFAPPVVIPLPLPVKEVAVPLRPSTRVDCTSSAHASGMLATERQVEGRQTEPRGAVLGCYSSGEVVTGPVIKPRSYKEPPRVARYSERRGVPGRVLTGAQVQSVLDAGDSIALMSYERGNGEATIEWKELELPA